MQIDCRLKAPDLDDDDLLKLTRDFRATVVSETEVQAEFVAGLAAPGTRGDPITIGAMALTFLSSGAAVALIKVLETYVARRPSLEIELSRPDGTKFSMKAENLKPDIVAETQRALQTFFRP